MTGLTTFPATRPGECGGCDKSYRRGEYIGEIWQGRQRVFGHPPCLPKVARGESAEERRERFEERPYLWL